MTNGDLRLDELQTAIGYQFQNASLLQEALRHPSKANELKLPSYQRLEFLGDAVVQLAASSMLFEQFPGEREGHLTSRRTKMVRTEALAGLARALGLQAFIMLGKGEAKDGGADKDSILADAFEAMAGAILVDGGESAAMQFVSHMFTIYGRALPSIVDYKTKLQEVTQAKWRVEPVYETIANDGPAHSRIYTVRVLVPGTGHTATAQASSTKAAEQSAALQLLPQLKDI